MNKGKVSLLWKISIKKDFPETWISSYLFGTMHSASLQAWAHLDAIKPYILTCNHFYGETNEEGLHQHPSLLALPEQWKGVRHLVGKNRYEKIDRLLNKNYSLQIERLDSLPPLMITSLISEVMMCHSNSNDKILDQELWRYAHHLGLTVDGIESAREQFEIYSQIPLTFQLKQLKKFLVNLTRSRKKLMILAEAYKKNDLHSLFRLSKNSLGDVRRILLYNRNKVMAKRISQILNNHEPNFVAIGAAHLPGNKGVLKYLKSEGIRVEPIPL